MNNFPFLALVGQDDMKLALILNIINPSLGGVLIRGEKGTAKSTAVRGLAALLPEQEVILGCRFGCQTKGLFCPSCQKNKNKTVTTRATPLVELPVGATEDRVLGTLDLEEALTKGKKKFEPGLLASANRGILYVDEVNLLDDHLVDILLDAAAMGTNTIEREGLSFSHAANFTLIGTMNPEEGELRPQLLDRFGLCVKVCGLNEPKLRKEIICRRLEFDKDRQKFNKKWQEDEIEFRKKLAEAKQILPTVKFSDNSLEKTVNICLHLGVDGHRADLTLIKTAIAIAAWQNKASVTDKHLFQAALLALPHRMRRQPFQEVDFQVAAKLNDFFSESKIDFNSEKLDK